MKSSFVFLHFKNGLLCFVIAFRMME